MEPSARLVLLEDFRKPHYPDVSVVRRTVSDSSIANVSIDSSMDDARNAVQTLQKVRKLSNLIQLIDFKNINLKSPCLDCFQPSPTFVLLEALFHSRYVEELKRCRRLHLYYRHLVVASASLSD